MSTWERWIIVVAWAVGGLLSILKAELAQSWLVRYQKRYPYPRWVRSLQIVDETWWEGKGGLFFIRAIGACQLVGAGIVLASLLSGLAHP